jgi:hypothetical protein
MTVIYGIPLITALVLTLLLHWWAVIILCAIGIAWWAVGMWVQKCGAPNMALGCGLLMIVFAGAAIFSVMMNLGLMLFG